MTELYIAYSPLTFPELKPHEDATKNRVSKSMLIARMEAEANADFLKKAVIEPFEDALQNSGRDEFDTEEFIIEIKKGRTNPSTSWAKVHGRLSEFLSVRADDSRAATYEGVKYFEGVGYCLKVECLQSHIEKLIDGETTKPSASVSLKWPAKKKNEDYPSEITISNKGFYRVTRENGRAVLQAKRIVSGVTEKVVKPYKAELQRWFETNTGYYPPEKIPDEELGHDERVVEFARGSYGSVQLVREANPMYKEAIATVRTALQDMQDYLTVQQFRSTNDTDGTPYVNIKSVGDFLTIEGMKANKLIKVESRYNITP
ncbi:hypothetical protein HY450_00890 [Candidatus Pacearchaeota archaeon]|nr:hypothetical protein [Candidatus Pacearchaeota archaeon]